MNKKFQMYVILIFILGVMAYLDSPYSFINKNYTFTANEPVVAQPIEQKEKTETPEVVEKLVNTEKSDGYIIESYQEFEVYKDKNGEIIKSVPTSKIDTLKYWDYEK